MKLDIEIISKELLKPSSPTPNHKKTVQRSFLDQLAIPKYIPINLFYTNSDEHSLNIPETLLHLKKSLSETLTCFYPYAGRIKDMFSIDCNDEGVIYTEARVSCQISEFLQDPDIHLLYKFLPCKPLTFVDIDVSSLPLFGVQVNVFECGGVVIGCCFSHLIGDATTISVFLNTWAKAARGCVEDEAISSPDFTLASTLFPPRHTFPDGIEHPNLIEGGKLITKRFLFNAESLARLKAEVATNTNPYPSRVQSITALTWLRYLSCKCILTGTPFPKVSTIIHVVNLRPRVEPPLSSCSVGNLCGIAGALYESQETSKEGLEEGKLLQELAMKVKNDFGSFTKSLKNEEEFELFKIFNNIEFANNICMSFTSWCRMGLYEVDFGWGKPVWVGCIGQVEDLNEHKYVGGIFFDSGPADVDPGIELWVSLPEEEMAILEKDTQFLKFASLNPSIIPC